MAMVSREEPALASELTSLEGSVVQPVETAAHWENPLTSTSNGIDLMAKSVIQDNTSLRVANLQNATDDNDRLDMNGEINGTHGYGGLVQPNAKTNVPMSLSTKESGKKDKPTIQTGTLGGLVRFIPRHELKSWRDLGRLEDEKERTDLSTTLDTIRDTIENLAAEQAGIVPSPQGNSVRPSPNPRKIVTQQLLGAPRAEDNASIPRVPSQLNPRIPEWRQRLIPSLTPTLPDDDSADDLRGTARPSNQVRRQFNKAVGSPFMSAPPEDETGQDRSGMRSRFTNNLRTTTVQAGRIATLNLPPGLSSRVEGSPLPPTDNHECTPEQSSPSATNAPATYDEKATRLQDLLNKLNAKINGESRAPRSPFTALNTGPIPQGLPETGPHPALPTFTQTVIQVEAASTLIKRRLLIPAATTMNHQPSTPSDRPSEEEDTLDFPSPSATPPLYSNAPSTSSSLTLRATTSAPSSSSSSSQHQQRQRHSSSTPTPPPQPHAPQRSTLRYDPAREFSITGFRRSDPSVLWADDISPAAAVAAIRGPRPAEPAPAPPPPSMLTPEQMAQTPEQMAAARTLHHAAGDVWRAKYARGIVRWHEMYLLTPPARGGDGGGGSGGGGGGGNGGNGDGGGSGEWGRLKAWHMSAEYHGQGQGQGQGRGGQLNSGGGRNGGLQLQQRRQEQQGGSYYADGMRGGRENGMGMGMESERRGGSSGGARGDAMGSPLRGGWAPRGGERGGSASRGSRGSYRGGMMMNNNGNGHGHGNVNSYDGPSAPSGPSDPRGMGWGL